MASQKISDLPARTVVAGTDEVPIISGGANYRSPLSSIGALSMLTSSPIELLPTPGRTTDGSPGGVDWEGGPGLLSVYGAWGTSVVQIAYSPDAGTTYIDTDAGFFETNASRVMEFPPGKVRATIAGTTTGTSLSAKLESTR